MARYDKSPRNKGGKVERPEEKARDEAEKTAGSPPTAEDPKGAIDTDGDRGPSAGEHGDNAVMSRHKGEVKDMLARHQAEHEQMIERHHGEISKTHSRHAKESTAPSKPVAEAHEKAKETAGSPPKLGEKESVDPYKDKDKKD